MDNTHDQNCQTSVAGKVSVGECLPLHLPTLYKHLTDLDSGVEGARGAWCSAAPAQCGGEAVGRSW